jgi:SAM-dependent methyltransferase
LPVIGRLARQKVKFPRNARYGDIRIGLPVPESSCVAVYCSHTLEHLALDDAKRAIRNTFKLLRSGGTFRFVLPDLEALARAYLSSTEHHAASDFMASSYLGMKSRPVGLAGLARQWLGNSSHLWMWDYKGIVPELEAAGFREVRRAQFGDWADARFQDVEEPSRWENCLGVECRRP